MTKQFALEKDIQRETDKAVLVRAYSATSGYHNVWLPKSQIEIGEKFIFIPAWLADAKTNETGKGFGFTKLEIAREAEKIAA